MSTTALSPTGPAAFDWLNVLVPCRTNDFGGDDYFPESNPFGKHEGRWVRDTNDEDGFKVYVFDGETVVRSASFSPESAIMFRAAFEAEIREMVR